jgi:hypothetical protein
MDFIMQLKNDQNSINVLDGVVRDYYKKNGDRKIRHFLWSEDKEWNSVSSYFLMDRKHVIKLSIGMDRGIYLLGIELAIGPHYFGPADFWSYEDSHRFKMDADTWSVTCNLMLLDEFLGYEYQKPWKIPAASPLP